MASRAYWGDGRDKYGAKFSQTTYRHRVGAARLCVARMLLLFRRLFWAPNEAWLEDLVAIEEDGLQALRRLQKTH